MISLNGQLVFRVVDLGVIVLILLSNGIGMNGLFSSVNVKQRLGKVSLLIHQN